MPPSANEQHCPDALGDVLGMCCVFPFQPLCWKVDMEQVLQNQKGWECGSD